MRAVKTSPLPLAPLIRAYQDVGIPSTSALCQIHGLGPRFAAILSATAKFFYADFLESASADDFRAAVVRFYESTVTPPLHVETVRARCGIVRHALGYLLRSRESVAVKAENCLDPAGVYHVPGLGPSFWSAFLQAMQPAHHPGWTSAIVRGLARLGFVHWKRDARAETIYSALLSAYARIQKLAPGLSALHVDHFLMQVAAMQGRRLPGPDEVLGQDRAIAFSDAARKVQSRLPLRECLKERGEAIACGQERMESSLANCDGKGIGDALALADLEGCLRSTLDWRGQADNLTLWVGRLWESDDPYKTLANFWSAQEIPGAGLWLPAAAAHLRDPQQFAQWNEEIRASYAILDDGDSEALSPAIRYRVFNEGIAWLRQHHQIHPLQMPAILCALKGEDPEDSARTFGGFCSDTFRFLAELGHNNRREWMERHRDRYRFAVREPLIELCRALAVRYVVPVLNGVHGNRLDVEPRNGRALTSICKNAFGRSEPYNTALWIAFCRCEVRPSRADVQFFVRLDAERVRFGLRLGRKLKKLVAHFRRQVQRYADALFQALEERGAVPICRFGTTESPELSHPITSAEELRIWSEERSFEVARTLTSEAVLENGEDLIGEILLTFDRLLPLYGCFVEENVEVFLGRCLGKPFVRERYDDEDFIRATYQSREWLERARNLLQLKRQLILQGVPGTGKTHVARHLARLLTGGREDCVRMVQFHPAYSYEEFVEGIKVRSVTVEGRSDVTYPVEAGLLCEFAAEAERRPAETFVLVIDEINRGNLPRIFGELLYLLEYREQSVCLPCSRRSFRLPANLYLLATMNAADRSAVLLDRALRRRFSFLEMSPDASLLARWLGTSSPPIAERARILLDRLNVRLRADLGPQAQIGHSFFMVPDLDEARLRIIWQHHVRPQLEEHFAAQPERISAYDLDALLNGDVRRTERRRHVETVP